MSEPELAATAPLHKPRSTRLSHVLSFALVAGGLLTAYYYPGEEGSARLRFFDWYLSGYARATCFVLGFFEPNLSTHGRYIIGRASFEIVKGCDAMDVAILLGSAILTFPCRWRQRLIALPLALCAVMALNVFRICTLYFVELHAPASFELVHMELWPPVLVVAAAGGFLLWSRRAIAWGA
jgi:exosortase/archaeosortase family protein